MNMSIISYHAISFHVSHLKGKRRGDTSTCSAEAATVEAAVVGIAMVEIALDITLMQKAALADRKHS